MRIVIHPDYEKLGNFLRRLPDNFERKGELIYNKRNCVKRFVVNGQTLIVKRFKRPHLIQRLVYTFFKKTKAERAYLYAGIFRQRGFQTPHEVAFIEQQKMGLFLDSWFVSTECSDPSLLEVMNKNGFAPDAAKKVAQLLTDLHKKGILHGDLNLSNILYHRTETGDWQFTLIDTNRSRFISNPNRTTCLENLKRLSHNQELLKYVVQKYAILRNWDPDECVRQALEYLASFEKKCQRKRKLKSLLGIKKK